VNENPKKIKISITESMSQVAPYLGLGTQLAATIAIMTFVGVFLDNKFQTKPVFILICTFFGAFAGLYNFIKSITGLEKKNKNDKK
jgi:ATP synthase protein I